MKNTKTIDTQALQGDLLPFEIPTLDALATLDGVQPKKRIFTKNIKTNTLQAPRIDFPDVYFMLNN